MTERPAVRIVGVRRLADYLRLKVERDPHLQSVAVRGEVTNYKVMRSGHVGFDLKEGDAAIGAFVWQRDAANLPPLRNGLSIVAFGSVRVYLGASKYQIYVTGYELTGVGDVHVQFEERKRRLAAEGLFAPERKRPLPRFPFAVGVVSSRTANGAVDFLTLLRERAPHVRVRFFETAVQGAQAAPEIATAIDRASRADVDLIVVTRGGGSFEDLFVFSDETVVRAVARARHPVVSAIGHTADQQLCDFAADRHFETPSAAAKAIGEDTFDLLELLDDRMGRARRAVALDLERRRGRLNSALLRSKLVDSRAFFAPRAQRVADLDDELAAAVASRARRLEDRVRALRVRLEAHDPSARLAARKLRLDAARIRLDGAVRARLVDARRRESDAAAALGRAARAATGRFASRLALLGAQLAGKDPDAILQRGYARVEYGGKTVTDAASVPAGAAIAARLARGTLHARVEGKTSDGN